MYNIDQKVKYQEIIDRLTVINQEIQDLEKNIIALENLMNKSIVVNNSAFKNETIIGIKKNIKYCNLSIVNNLIPIINKRIYK